MKQAHILLVEDNEGDIILTLEAFEESKLKTDISVVKNGQQALDFLFQRGEYADAQKPDIIILDINIPIFNGHEVLKQIKADPILKMIPVIMLTTSSNKKDIRLTYENHGNSFITKPIDINEFLKTILKIEEFWLHLTKLAD
jgi:CheY-like chemotaxis protein